LQAAIEAGADPAALVDPINRAQEQVKAARVACDQAPPARGIGRAEIEAMLDHLGDIGAALTRARPERLTELYGSLDLQLTDHPDDRLVDVRLDPRRGSERVRGGRCSHAPRRCMRARRLGTRWPAAAGCRMRAAPAARPRGSRVSERGARMPCQWEMQGSTACHSTVAWRWLLDERRGQWCRTRKSEFCWRNRCQRAKAGEAPVLRQRCHPSHHRSAVHQEAASLWLDAQSGAIENGR
jgi:hypothetical protein